MRRKEYLATSSRDAIKGAIAGAAGGLAASWVMNRFQSLLSKASNSRRQQGQREHHEQHEIEPATTQVATTVSKRIFHHTLTEPQKKIAEPAVHYAFGTTMGAVYGTLTEVLPAASFGFGLLYGTGLWFMADEVAVPALRLSKAPTRYPFSTHAYALASHWVYAMTAESIRRMIRPVL